MVKRLIHIGIAVKDAAWSTDLFSRLLGVPPSRREEVAEQKVGTVFLQVGGTGLELLEPISPDSAVGRFIEKRGEGVHHLSFEVDDLDAEIERLKADGFQLVDENPRGGAGGYRIAFLHPRSTNGVLIELSEKISTGQPYE